MNLCWSLLLYPSHREGVQEDTAFRPGSVHHVLSDNPHEALSVYHGIRCYMQSILELEIGLDNLHVICDVFLFIIK